MKKITIFSLSAFTFALGLVACNNNSDSTASTDTTTTTSTNTAATTTQTSSRNYAALSDSFRTNSKAGYYLDPRTGKSINLSMDTTSGAVTDVTTGRPVMRYVDKRTWWVYNANTGDTLGSARMQSGQLRYRGDNDKWMTYDERWQGADTANSGSSNMSNNGNTGTSGSNDDGSSMNNGSNTNGTSGTGNIDKMKIKTDNQKIKVTKNGTKVKPE